MSPWKALLLVYPAINVSIPRDRSSNSRFINELSGNEIQDAVNSFRAFPALAEDLSNGEATITYEIVIVQEPLSSVSLDCGEFFWPSPNDTRRELDVHAPHGRFDSIFALWPQTNFQTGAKIPCRGWGLGMESGEWSNGATYAVVGNAPTWMWSIPIVGEVWLHEWLHGVCRDAAERGIAMPAGDADAGGSHGYIQSETTGWTDFYRDLMTGQVKENGKRTGMTTEGWRGRIPRGK